ncbi:MAG: asparagine--tRNA ligase [Bernardetiaceae bacterium]|nr:asparagine--tRNA ligase [Bernardetiaceae bacterium]
MFRVRNFLLEKKKLTFGKTTTWGGLSYQSPTSNQISAVYSNEFKGLFLNVEELIEKHFFNKHKHFFEGLVNFCKQEEQDRLINYETPKSLLWSSPTEIDALSEVWKKYEHTDKLTVAKEINAFFTSEQEKYILDLLGKSMKSNDTVNTINFINNIPITKLCFHNWIPSNLLDDNESVEFFGRKTHLTVSGQLEAELGALGLGKVYTFGPTFRAENSNTTRHLAEFWMIEPEMAFYEIEDNMDLAEDFLKYLIRFALENYADDLAFLDKRFTEENNAKKKEERAEQGLLEKLQSVIETDFVRISYTEAIDILLQSKPHKKGKFQYPVEWGIDLQSEHERFLVEKHFKKPVILSNYPRDIKAFYMKQNEGEEAGKETVRAMDVLCPGIGEIIGGSQREENYEKLKARTDAMGITDELWWYLDTRKFGTVPHSGFGLGFERLVLFVTGMSNIRDVIPFPRTPKNAEF